MASSISGTSVEKEGYLWVKHPKQQKQLKVKKWQYKYVVLKKCSEYKSSGCLEWYESIEDFLAFHSPTNFIRLDAINFVGKIESQKKEFAFILFVGDKQQQLATKDEAGQTEWIEAIKQFQHLNPGAVSPTIDPKSCFLVKFNGTTSNCELLKDKTDYLLTVGPKYITLLTSGAVKERVVSWSLATIKSYKSHTTDSQPSKKLLTIETGRQSSTGRGVFNFLTQFGDQIADKVRLNTNRTYLAKVNSQDSFNLDAVYSSSPETAPSRLSSSPNRLRSIRMSPSLSVRSSSSSIPFHQYDSPSGSPRESFANYVSDGTGYIHVFTKQEDVEESRRDKARKASQPSTEQEPTSPDDDHSAYIEVLQEPDDDSSAYIEVIGEHEASEPTKSRETQRPRGPSDEYGDQIYIAVLGDDEQMRATEESGTKYEETSSETRDKIRHDMRQTSHVSPRGTRHQIRHESHREMRKTRESSVSSAHWRSLTSQTSSFEYSSVSSENEVFSRERDMSLTSDVFPEVEEPTTSADDILEEVSEKNNNLTESFGETENVRESLGKSGGFRESHESEPKDQTVDTDITNCKNACASSENLSENCGNARASSGNLSENSGNTCGNSENSCDDDNSKTSSFHSEAGRDAEDTSELRDDSTNTSSTSDDGNPRDSQDLSDDELGEKSGPGPRRRSEEILSGSDSFLKGAFLGDELDPKMRNRSLTTGDMRSLENCEEYSPLKDLIERVTNPQDYFPPKKHPPLARTTTAVLDQGGLEEGTSFQQKIIDELMNPTVTRIESGSRKLSTRRQSNEIKYLCTECGWTKMWREKSRWKKARATKNCGRCNKVITKSNSKCSVKRKESSSKNERTGSLLGRFTSKFHSSTSVDYVEPAVRPERSPPAHQESLFLKNLKQGHLSIHTHLGSEAGMRLKLGIAPSPSQTAHALSIGGGSLASSKSPPIKNENVLPATKRPLTTTRSEESVPSGSQGESSVAGRNGVSKTLTYTPAHEAGKGNNLLKRANSSPVCIGTVSGSPEFPRKNSSSNALPSLPEVEDISERTGNVRSGSFTDTPPAVPPRIREEPPPVPPRRGTRTQISRGNSTKLIRAQTDPTNSVTIPSPGSPMLRKKALLSRTMTDPGNKHIRLNDNMRTAVSLGNLLENSQDSKTGTNRTLIRVVSLSLGDGLDTPPPPLPPRKNSGTPPPPLSPRRVSNDSGKPSCESQTFSESARQLPENGSFASPSKKLPLVAKKTQEARENFKSRIPVYSEHVNEAETVNSSS